MERDLVIIRSVADFQFGRGVGCRLFPENVDISHSKATGRIRYIRLNGERLATLRPTDGLLSLSIKAARAIVERARFARCFVRVQKEVSEFIANGRDVFAAHVVEADDTIRSKDEVIVLDEDDQVLAVGRALLSSSEMKAFKIGVAVRVRHGCTEES
jgi:conserved protein with predicted RNA binding PUA domain